MFLAMDIWAPMWLILATFWSHFPGFNHFLATFEGIILIFSLYFVFHHLAIFSVILFMLNMLINSLSMMGHSHATWSNTRLVPLCQGVNTLSTCQIMKQWTVAAIPQNYCHQWIHWLQFLTFLSTRTGVTTAFILSSSSFSSRSTYLSHCWSNLCRAATWFTNPSRLKVLLVKRQTFTLTLKVHYHRVVSLYM